ncbi:hypothetical protein D0863_08991 [Hortaea werneckii]|uniref:Zn(2)-C6 fungal-type domain-containing protein n=1 Tax=Hortaea werneckii TaxID=91943 RepID=A0A3M7DNH1_HORWE|nr:hypothetical protein D0863_08991 [Hortaea werneckii]
MARVSFGSRAGGNSDYLAGRRDVQRTSRLNGLYDSLNDLCSSLKEEIAACQSGELLQLTTCELSIREQATLPLLQPVIGPYSHAGPYGLPAEYKTDWMEEDEGYPGINAKLPKTTISHILAAEEGQARQSVQRAASRAIVQAIEASDGFKYSFNNAWAAKDDRGLRFSYICQDSMQNKDRHANGFTKTQKHLKGEGERGPRKPTYDCKGSISVKFSQVRRTVDIYYRHNAVHASVAERKPPPRAPPRRLRPGYNDSVNDVGPAGPRSGDTGGLMGALWAEESAYARPRAMPPPPPPEVSNISRPLKRKRTSDLAPPPSNPEKPLSLVDLLKQSSDAKAPAQPETPQPKPVRGQQPPVDYSLPWWQGPAAVAAPPAPSVQGVGDHPPMSAANYVPPYQPQQYYGKQILPQPLPMPPPPQSPSQAPDGRRYQGAPSKVTVPKGQGLFSTLKPVRTEERTTYEPHFIMYNGVRAKASCQNCRFSKKKCDEVRPLCGGCARSGKLDCVYEAAPNRSSGPSMQDSPGLTAAPSQRPSHVQPSPTQGTPGSQTHSQPQRTYTPQAPCQPVPYSMQAQYSSTAPYPSAAGSNPYAVPQGTMSTPTMDGSQASHDYQNEYAQSQPQFGDQSMSSREESPDPWFPRR